MTERAIAFISLGAAALILVTTTLLGLFPITRALLVYYIFLTAAIYTLLYLVANRIELEAEKARAEQARKILRVAEQTLPYLRQGLDISSAQHVARIIFPETRAIAVAVTDRKKILAFVGEGEDHHYPGKKIITRATKTAIKESRSMVLQRKDEIGCPSTKCPLKAAIVMPIRHEGEAVGTIKFYYGKEGPVSDAEVALAEGLAHLLETQLELSKLSRLETLACQAELRALQAQISPHFFFNVLNTAIAYCRTDPLEARKLLMDFSSFFRATIEHGEETLITLDAELNYLATYLELEKARFGNRLLYTISVSRKALTWPIPRSRCSRLSRTRSITASLTIAHWRSRSRTYPTRTSASSKFVITERAYLPRSSLTFSSGEAVTASASGSASSTSDSSFCLVRSSVSLSRATISRGQPFGW